MERSDHSKGRAGGSRGTRGFTVVEVIAVVVVLGILSAAAAPALSTIEDARRAAAVGEVERVLIAARARAMATARPTGVRLSPDGRELTVVEIASRGAEPTVVRDVFGREMAPVNLSASFAGAAVASMVNGDGTTGPGTVWFTHQAEPHIRTDAGVMVEKFSRDAEITLAPGGTVVVRMVTGAVGLP